MTKGKLTFYFWILIVFGIAFPSLLMTLMSFNFFGDLPNFEELENPKTNLATQILSTDGKVLGTYFKENRTNARFEELSPFLIQCLVATEDERYYSHSGIDLRGLTRAIVYMGTKGGASTITQQLAKMLFHNSSSNIVKRIYQKLQEWVIAVELEKQ